MARGLMVFAVSILALGCGGDSNSDGDAGAEPDASLYDPPDDGVVPPIGSTTTLELASWNIENFPREDATPKMVADLIASMDLDIIAVQEVEDIDAWDELVARLPEHGGVLSSHTYGNGTYQKIGYLYRRSLVTLEGGTQLFDNEASAFPRPPLQVVATVDDGVSELKLVLISLHLKAGRDFNDRQRREEALALLEPHVQNTASAIAENVVILGDFNEVVTTTSGRDVFAPFLTAPTSYTVETEALAQSGAFSFVPSGAVLDHAITTSSLDDERAGGTVVIPPLHTQYAPYNANVSDHLPVIITLAL